MAGPPNVSLSRLRWQWSWLSVPVVDIGDCAVGSASAIGVNPYGETRTNSMTIAAVHVNDAPPQGSPLIGS